MFSFCRHHQSRRRKGTRSLSMRNSIISIKNVCMCGKDPCVWVACASSFVILFCGFLFFSDLLTSSDSAIVLW